MYVLIYAYMDSYIYTDAYNVYLLVSCNLSICLNSPPFLLTSPYYESKHVYIHLYPPIFLYIDLDLSIYQSIYIHLFV